MNTMRFIRLVVLCVLMILPFALAGCGENDGSSVTGKNFSAKDAIKIEDIDWTVTESVMDGERFISFNYTNNSSYTIMDVEMKFVQRSDITKDQLSVFDDLKADKEWTDEEVAETYILGYNRKYADPGEIVTDSPCLINGTHTLVESLAQYDIMEPDIVNIAFIGPDGKGYGVYYDFKTQTYSESSQGAQDLHQWSDSEISQLLPKAEFKAVIVSSDYNDSFCFDAYGVSREEFDAYVEAVKANGFTVYGYDSNNNYSAEKVDSIWVDVDYSPIEETMSVVLW